MPMETTAQAAVAIASAVRRAIGEPLEIPSDLWVRLEEQGCDMSLFVIEDGSAPINRKARH